MSKDNIARGLANRAVEAIGSITGVLRVTTEERLAFMPSKPTIVYDTDLDSYFGYNVATAEWVDLGIIGFTQWGLVQGDIAKQTDLIDYLVATNIKETVTKQFVSQAEKDKWNGQTNTYIVNSIAELEALSASIGDFGVVLDINGTVGYIFDGSTWLQTTDTNWENINLRWDNIIDKPDLTNLSIKWENVTGAPNFDWRNF
jgi:hypothetical protein